MRIQIRLSVEFKTEVCIMSYKVDRDTYDVADDKNEDIRNMERDSRANRRRKKQQQKWQHDDDDDYDERHGWN